MDEREDERSELLEGFARAIFVSAWADACGEIMGETGDDSIVCYDCGEPLDGGPNTGPGRGWHTEDCAAYAIAQEHSPGAREDWMDYAPETSEHARKVARAALMEIAKINRRDLLAVYDENAALDGHEREPTIDLFGHYLAMQWLGHGVAWSDDHPDHGLKLGHGEYNIHDLRSPEEC